MQSKLNTTKKWFGEFEGVRYEINLQDNGTWTHYIHIALDRIPDSKLADKFWLNGIKSRFSMVLYSYYDSIINEIEFHGGCTWYSKESGFDGEVKSVRIGCDYAHLWDRGREYDLSYVEREVKITIESFIRIVGYYKRRCRGNGKLYHPKNMLQNGFSKFY